MLVLNDLHELNVRPACAFWPVLGRGNLSRVGLTIRGLKLNTRALGYVAVR